MTSKPSSLYLTGNEVTVSSVSIVGVGHGRFSLENGDASEAIVLVSSAWLDAGDHRKSLENVTLFDLERDETLNPNGFTVGGRTTLDFLMGFPLEIYRPGSSAQWAVGLRLRAGESVLVASSPIRFERRIPRDKR